VVGVCFDIEIEIEIERENVIIGLEGAVCP